MLDNGPVDPVVALPNTSFFCSEGAPNEKGSWLVAGVGGVVVVVVIAGGFELAGCTPNPNPVVAGLTGSAGLAKKLGTADAWPVGPLVSGDLVVEDGWLKKLFDVDVVAVGPIEGVVTVIVGTGAVDAADAADAAAASFSFFSLSAFSFSNLSFSCRSFSCLSFSNLALSAAAALSLSTLSLASLDSLSLASFSISFFLFASRTFMIALASNSCFSHFENTFAGAGVRGLPFVLSDKLDMPGESVPLTDDAR